MSLRRPRRFRVTRNGQPIELVPVRDVIATGIVYAPLMPGLVPLFEEREAAVYAHYSWMQWRELDPEERATVVAQYRMHAVIAQHQNDAVSLAMERRRARQQSQ